MYSEPVEIYLFVSSFLFTLYLFYKFCRYLVMVYNYHNAKEDKTEKIAESFDKTISKLDKTLDLISQKILLQNQLEENKKK